MREVERYAHRRCGVVRADRLDRLPLGDEEVVRDLQGGRPVAHTRGLDPFGVTGEGDAPGLVVRDPGGDEVPEL